ncbi:MAG TPA: methyltransferase [Dongiaceae bacterium]|nr:methyltransferase [Dongiaceae bacterium]
MTGALAQTTDTVLGGRVVLRQPADGYRVAIDPILLAAACPALAGETIADLGCGIGTAALCVAARVPGAQCLGVDIQAPLIELAIANAQANGVQDRVRFLRGDILDTALPVYAMPADQVIVNPPYLARGRATISANPIKALANVEGDADLEAWVAAAVRAVKPDGRVTFIHRADRLPELLAAFAARFGGIVTLPLHPKQDAPAHRVIVSGLLGQRRPAILLPGLILHQADGAFTPAVQRILRDGAPLPLNP